MNNQIKKLIEYSKSKLLNFEVEENVYKIDGKSYCIVWDDEELLFDENFKFVRPISNKKLDGHVYEFCGRWYLQENSDEVNMVELSNIGKALTFEDTKSFLGIRSGYEIMNGMGIYKDWVKKAQFLGVKNLGICEKDSLSGVLEFQNTCSSSDIKSIIGMTFTVDGHEIKAYAKDFQGWQNLLKINTQINVDLKNEIDVDFLSNNSEGLFVVLDPKTLNFEKVDKFKKISNFYQVDTVNYLDDYGYEDYTKNLIKFIKSDLEPLPITDAFYLDKEDFEVREALWSINKSFDKKTDNQFFKSKDEYSNELFNLFEVDDIKLNAFYDKMILNENILVESCNFKYDTGSRHLPKYIMTDEESKKFSSNEKLFLSLIKKGFEKRQLPKNKTYIDRVKKEIDVLRKGDVIDYFLRLYDVVKYSKDKGYLVGIGRGSAGGSLVAYLLGIIEINPLDFGLIFERFLNSGRMGELVDGEAYEIELENKEKITLIEGSIVKVLRNSKKINIFVEDLKESDNLIKY